MTITKQIIGDVKLEYAIGGFPTNVSFSPVTVNLSKEEIEAQFKQVKSQEIVKLKENSDTVFSNWLNSLVNIELLDNTKERVEGEVLECLQWEDGNIKKCVIRYSIVQI